MNTTTRAVLFDLDGTLADTLADLAAAVNQALAQVGCPTHPLASYRYFVGDGARNLIQRVLPADRLNLIEPVLALMRAHYDAHCFDQTRLYPGIAELVDELRRRGLKLAVLSNKPDEFTKRMIAYYFGHALPGGPRGACAESRSIVAAISVATNATDPFPPRSRTAAAVGPFDAVRGQFPNIPLKPDPTVALQLAGALDVPPAQWLYLGDTNTDMQTACAAGMIPVGVLWGFRDRTELVANGARHLLARPNDLLALL